VLKNRKVPSTIREPRGLERRAGVAVHHARFHGVRPCPQSTGNASGPGMRSKALFAPPAQRSRTVPRAAREMKRRQVSKNRKVGTVDGDPRTAPCYAPNERRRPRDARLQRGTASLDVDRGRVTVAHVRAGVSTRHRRLEEGQVARRKTLRDEHEQTNSNPNITSEDKTSFREVSCGASQQRHGARARDAHTTRNFPFTMTSVTRVDTAAARKDISSLPLEVISTHILKSEFLQETADLGRLHAVSKGMRDAVDATGREIKKLSDWEAVDLGYVSLLKARHTRGVLKDECLTCAAAARNGDLEELKALRAEKFPWDDETCTHAAPHGHLDVLKWVRANGCTWDRHTRELAALKGCFET